MLFLALFLCDDLNMTIWILSQFDKILITLIIGFYGRLARIVSHINIYTYIYCRVQPSFINQPFDANQLNSVKMRTDISELNLGGVGGGNSKSRRQVNLILFFYIK